MKEKQYTKLLIDVTTINTSLNFHQSRIADFESRCNGYCTDVLHNLELLNVSLQQLAATEAPDKLIASLERIKMALKKDIEAPALDYKKIIDKISKELHEKILPQLKAEAGPTAFDLRPIFKSVEQSKPLLTAIVQHLDLCFKVLLGCQEKIASLDEALQILDLPNSIERATKHLEKMTVELGSLEVQLSSSPNKSQYRTAFLPLSSALAKLRIQGESLVVEPKPMEDPEITTSPGLRLG